MRRIRIIFVLLAGLLLAGCNGLERPYEGTYEHVLIYGGLGFNNLSGDIVRNFEQIQEGILPGLSRDKAIVAFCHTAVGSNYDVPNPPRLMRIYRGPDGAAHVDTLKTYSEMTVSASKESLRQVFEDIQRMFPARHYGMLISSHGTGWIPGGYDSGSEASTLRERIVEPETPWPLTKALCNQFSGSGRNVRTRWLEFSDFVDAIPMKLDYMVIDACLMGTVEVVYELKDICDYLVVSPTEVMEYGMIYKTLSWDMLAGSKADLRTYCEEFYDYYNNHASAPYGTITLVDCSRVDALSDAFAAILDAHRDALDIRLSGRVQRYYYGSSSLRFYYDLRDLCVQLGASSAELERLDAALDACIPYHAETPYFFDLRLERCCGLSVYIPDPAKTKLNTFYSGLSWNRKVRLVD